MTTEQALSELKNVQKALDKARAEKYAVLAKAEKKVAELDAKRQGLRGQRKNLMEILAR